MNIKDTELRGIVLQKFYDKRSEGAFQFQGSEFADLDPSIEFDKGDLFRICDQLNENGLINWKGIRTHGMTIGGIGKISAAGVDVVEGARPAPMAISFEDKRQTITISGSANFQVGHANTQHINVTFHELSKAIETSTGSEEEKSQAKSIIRKALEHPMVNTLAGAAAQAAAGFFGAK